MKTSILAIACLVLSVFVKAQNFNLPQLKLKPFAEGFKYPIDLANAGDDRLFVVERLGKIWVIDKDGNRLSDKPFLNITDRVFTVFPQDYDERGLLGLAFHPNYPDSPYFYVNYIGLDSNSKISRFTVSAGDPNQAKKNSEVILLSITQPKAEDFVNHKAGCLKFGSDGYLYGTLGDGGSAGDPRNNAQDPTKLLGKLIRIDVDHPSGNKNYGIPSDNPFVGVSGWEEEIYSSGLRNPFRFSFDKETGDLWLPDVGQDKWEEINLHRNGVKGGQNYGWSCYEGNHNFKFNGCDYNGLPYKFPIVEYGHTSDNCAAITGGFVYRGTKYPKMMGRYIYCDYCTGKFSVVFQTNRTWLNIPLLDEDDGVYVSFGEDSKGELYVINQPDGEIERVVDASETGAEPSDIAVDKEFNLKVFPNPNHGQFTVEVNAPRQQSYAITITNVYGRTILSETKIANAGINKWSISSAQLVRGTYMLHVETTKGGVTQIIVVD